MPPITTSNNSVLVKIAIAAKAPPNAKEPVSPMNTFAGFTLYTKKPRHTAATIAPKYATLSAPIEFVIDAAMRPITEKAIAATADVPPARPSRPSVKFTAFVAPTIIKNAKT